MQGQIDWGTQKLYFDEGILSDIPLSDISLHLTPRTQHMCDQPVATRWPTECVITVLSHLSPNARYLTSQSVCGQRLCFSY